MQRRVGELAEGRFDLLVVGGGITGAGIALDACLRGLRVALVEKGDFASATSSASSKLIHGGLRYLERGEFGLVHDALRERAVLRSVAPHLVRPLRILLPHYAHATRPRWMIKLGLSLYDWLAGRASIGRHRWLDAAQVHALVPQLRGDGLRGGFEFYDAQTDDARLCLEVVLTAAAAGAQVANYVEAVEIQHDHTGLACGCEIMDRISGASFAIAARRIVNATGPWLDEICRIDQAAEPAHLSPTKGVHIVLPQIGLNAGLLMTHPDDGRVLFVLPWMNRMLIGTTDTSYEARPDDVAADREDVDYLLAASNHFFAENLPRSAVIATLVGLRPLLRGKAQVPSARSRDFAIFRSRSGLWSIGGGKYTTYRLMAEKMVDRLIEDLGGSAAQKRCHTAERRLIGAPAEDWESFRMQEIERLEKRLRQSPDSLGHLVDRYGCRARMLVDEFGDDPALWAPIVPGDPDVCAELHYQAAHEMAQCPADHLLRRTRLGLFHPELLIDDRWPISTTIDTSPSE